VDSNVFNTPESPSRDVTAVVVPGLDAVMRMGAARLTSRTLAEWHHFQKSSSERAVNLNQLGRIDLELTRIAPYLEGSYLRSRHRPNLEIDERVLEQIRTAAAGVLVTLGAQTSVDLGYRRSAVEFGDLADGSPLLADRLNRATEEALLEVRRALSPLTTLLVGGRYRRDRFAVEDLRDSDHLRATAALSLKPSALVSGTATVGVGRLSARHPSMPDHTGLVAAVRMSYILLEQTRFAVRFDRDVDYSFETAWPFFEATGTSLEIKQAVGYVWDAVVRGGLTDLAYRPFAGTGTAGQPSIDRRDRVVMAGLGGGRHLGDDIRVGVDLTHERRTSPVAGRSYSGYRVGGSLTYGY
jgi:hypothetical protein